jgi:hypothetical protein
VNTVREETAVLVSLSTVLRFGHSVVQKFAKPMNYLFENRAGGVSDRIDFRVNPLI